MSTITLDYGGANLSCECQRAGHAEPRRAGSKQPSFAQRLTSSVRREFMVIPLILAPKTPAQAAAIRALFALGAQVSCRGDVFNNGGATTVVCSGKISDELDQTASWWTINLTLYEVSAAAYTPPTIVLYLTNVAAGGGIFVASTDPADDPFGAGLGSVTLMDSPDVIPTCGDPLSPDPFTACPIGYSAAPEAVWESLPAPADGYIVGAPFLTFLSVGGTGDRWHTQAVMGKVFQVRSGTDVLEIDTGYSNGNGGFAGGFVAATAPAVVIAVQAGDTLRIEPYGRAGLNSGYASDGVLQVLTHGNGGGGSHYASLTYRGTALFQ